MGILPRSKGSDDEKHPSSPHEVGPVETTELGVVDESQDDLHREMKPRQLSE